jgi:hypothetical protein
MRSREKAPNTQLGTSRFIGSRDLERIKAFFHSGAGIHVRGQKRERPCHGQASGSCRNANPCRAPSHACSPHACSRPRCEHQEYDRRAQPARAEQVSMRTTLLDERVSRLQCGLTRTRTTRGWMSRHGTRLVNGLKATPRRGAPLPRATNYGRMRVRAGPGGGGGTAARLAPRRVPVSAHSGESVCARIRYSTYAFAT